MVTDLALFRGSGAFGLDVSEVGAEFDFPSRLMRGGGYYGAGEVGIIDSNFANLTWTNVSVTIEGDPAITDYVYMQQYYQPSDQTRQLKPSLFFPTWQGYTNYYTLVVWLSRGVPTGPFEFWLVLNCDQNSAPSRLRCYGTIFDGEIEKSWHTYGGYSIFTRIVDAQGSLVVGDYAPPGSTITLYGPRSLGEYQSQHGASLGIYTGAVDLTDWRVNSWTPYDESPAVHTSGRLISCHDDRVDPEYVAIEIDAPALGFTSYVQMTLDNGSQTVWQLPYLDREFSESTLAADARSSRIHWN